MIGVIMRPEDGVDLFNVICQQLRPQICRCVDEDSLSGIILNDDRHTGTAVARFVRIAFAPVVSDAGHPGGGTRTEHKELHGAALLKRA